MLENISEQLSFAFWVSNPIYMSFIPTLLIRSEAVPSAPSEVSGHSFLSFNFAFFVFYTFHTQVLHSLQVWSCTLSQLSLFLNVLIDTWLDFGLGVVGFSSDTNSELFLALFTQLKNIREIVSSGITRKLPTKDLALFLLT